MDVEIKIADLRLAINRILDHIENELGHTSVALGQDYYWEVHDADKYDFNKTPNNNYMVGNLYDDWEFLSATLKDKDQAIAYMVVHAAPLLRYIGEEVSGTIISPIPKPRLYPDGP
ncbi:MAG: hypothetical protein LBI31_06820 [Zoogloeaceae bacterium]|jgi:hypothetical protein|nr:hypothetical protein [Zoogloeaceae bacterium]